MRLTPLDIRKQEFTRAFRGYEPEEIQAFLQMVSTQWEQMQDEKRRLEDKVRGLEDKLQHYQKVEEALQEALQTARETSRKALENAELKARLIIDEAEKRADEIKREAEQERHQIKRDAAKLSGRRNEIAARLRAFLMSEMELLARFEGDDPIGFIKLLPAEEERLRQARGERSLPAADASKREGPPSDPTREAPDDEEPDDPFAGAEGDAEEDEEQAYAGAGPPAPEERRSPRINLHRQPTDYEADDPFAPPAPEEEEAEAPQAYDRADYGVAPQADYADDEEEDEAPAAEPPRPGQQVKHGQGWTARTVVSMPSSGRPADSEKRNVTASTDEIEKIRKILSDLD